MKKPKKKKTNGEEKLKLRLRPRPLETVPLQIPVDALASLERVAANREMSSQALMKFYIGQGLRQDLAKLYADRVMDRTAEVLARHLPSQDEVSAIIREIREEAAV
ncbi:MAG: hypothetical protein AAB354_13490 [candidate division KSB1 bacterium]